MSSDIQKTIMIGDIECVVTIFDSPSTGLRTMGIVLNDPASDEPTVRTYPCGAIDWFSIGVYVKDGVPVGIYAVYDYDSGVGCWYFRATINEIRDPNRHHFVGGQLSELPRRFVCNTGDDDERMLIGSGETGAINRIRLAGQNPEWVGGPRVNSWLQFDEWQPAGTSPAVSLVVRGETATLTEERPDVGLYEYKINLNGWPLSGGQPVLVSNAPAPDPTTTDPVDLNNDGIIDTADLGILIEGFGKSGPGDLNNDGVVDTADLALLLAAMNKEGE